MDEDELFFEVIEAFPNMVFIKCGDKATRCDYDTGFRYLFFNGIMNAASGFDRHEMIGQNAKDHFPVHYGRYFEDDQAVMELQAGDPSAVRDIIEPWKVATGDHVLHTRKCNLSDRYMLGTFIKADELHTATQALERRRPVSQITSSRPASPAAAPFWRSVWEWLPVPVLLSFPEDPSRSAMMNQAFLSTFRSSEDQHAITSLQVEAAEGEVYERGGMEVGGCHSHLLQQRLRVPKGGPAVVVSVVWPTADAQAVAQARAALD